MRWNNKRRSAVLSALLLAVLAALCAGGCARQTAGTSPEGESSSPRSQEPSCTCSLSISCAALLEHLDDCDPEKRELIPEDGWILEPVDIAFSEGESVFQVLQRACRQENIHMEYTQTPLGGGVYIEGIHNLYEFDAGELSGWMYSVNGWFPNYGCGSYPLSDGDAVEWVYTCDLGADVGGGYSSGEQTARSEGGA